MGTSRQRQQRRQQQQQTGQQQQRQEQQRQQGAAHWRATTTESAGRGVWSRLHTAISRDSFIRCGSRTHLSLKGRGAGAWATDGGVAPAGGVTCVRSNLAGVCRGFGAWVAAAADRRSAQAGVRGWAGARIRLSQAARAAGEQLGAGWQDARRAAELGGLQDGGLEEAAEAGGRARVVRGSRRSAGAGVYRTDWAVGPPCRTDGCRGHGSREGHGIPAQPRSCAAKRRDSGLECSGWV